MNRNNIFTRTKADLIKNGVKYWDEYANMNFLDFGQPIYCYTVNVLNQHQLKLKVEDKCLLETLNQYERIKYCHSIGEVLDLRKHGFPFFLVVTSQSTDMTTGVSDLVFELIPECNFTKEQMEYLFKDRVKQDIYSVLLNLKHPFRTELIERIKEVNKNWNLIEIYKDLIPKDYYIQYDSHGAFEVFDVYNPKLKQRIGCSKKFRTLKGAIKFLWTAENNGKYWNRVRSVKDIPLKIKRKLKEVAA